MFSFINFFVFVFAVLELKKKIGLSYFCNKQTTFGIVSKNVIQYLLSKKQENVIHNSDIIIFSFNKPIQNTNVVVTLSHLHLTQKGDKIKCVFWYHQKSN